MRFIFVCSLLAVFSAACATSQPIGQQDYAKLRNKRTFEYPMQRIWKGVEEVLRKYRVVERDPEETPAPVDLSHLSEAVWETDWVYGRSRTKFIEFKVNDVPKKQLLQNRVRYVITANRVIGGTELVVETNEEVEELSADGSSNGYSETEADSALASDFLDRLQTTLHSLPD